jgi:hypothetical protein
LADTIHVSIDPATILGVSPGASLQEIRDAYRTKAKRYHPDAGGEEWVFRILVQSYEMLSTERVLRASTRESAAPPRASSRATGAGASAQQSQAYARAEAPPPPQPEPPYDTGPRQEFDPNAARESVRQGVHEHAADPSRVVEVEKLSIRYQPDHVWLITEQSSEHRFLSSCLNLNWPSTDVTTPPGEIVGADSVLKDLEIVFTDVSLQTQAGSARSDVTDGRFSGWLSYPTGVEASEAFNLLRRALHNVGLAVNQTTRDVVIPRQR